MTQLVPIIIDILLEYLNNWPIHFFNWHFEDISSQLKLRAHLSLQLHLIINLYFLRKHILVFFCFFLLRPYF